MGQLAVVMKRTETLIEKYCTNSECHEKTYRRLENVSVPVGIFDCMGWAEAWIDKQPKEKDISYYIVGVEFAPKIED